MNKEWNEYTDTTLLEETVGDILSKLPWENLKRDELKDNVLAIIDSYEGRQEEIRLICIYWLLSSGLLDYKVHKKFRDDSRIFYKMITISRSIMNGMIKKENIHASLPPATKH
ncbi:hypothetical protein [Xenorhabdus sp. PB30.3]|uniref:hypothetical protein n=1 Tax=Xenorhabdus sp. PB30.3 TaxID=2788941 RepID=UPI001E589D32|nr:hypothetical protein [Xenorhabdus sp. PB30.3]MCC8379098.1 hypothetical protein [Xenorhabdus sp. PB30.3]